MPTLAATKQAVSYAASGYLVLLRAELAEAEIVLPGISDSVLMPAAVSAGLAACGIYPEDPNTPLQSDVDLMAAKDWRKFYLFASIWALEFACGVVAALPKSNQYGGSEHRVDWDRSLLFDLLQAKKKEAEKAFPDVTTDETSERAMTVAWLVVGGRNPRPEF